MTGGRRVALLAAAGLAAAGLLGWGLLAAVAPASRHPARGVTPSGGGSGTPSPAGPGTPSPAGSGTPSAVPIARFGCPVATVTVADAEHLKRVLREVRPGQVIRLADGVYPGGFTARTSGSAMAPIYLCGGRGAVLEGRSRASAYGLHLRHVAHWRLSGFSVRNAQKGVVLDASTDVGLQDLLVEQVGDEGVHLRENSSGDVVRGLTVRDTGLVRAEFGEGLYVGSAKSNWDGLTGGRPDRSDRNYLVENTVSRTTAEAVDVKEGTTAGLIAGNAFDGTGLRAASAWVNVKGNGWVVTGNRGVSTPRDGFQVHVVLAGWGRQNVFSGNRADLTGSPDGVAVRVQEPLGNVVACTNTTIGGRPLSNLSCRATQP